jgi:hypothetical protein
MYGKIFILTVPDIVVELKFKILSGKLNVVGICS